MAPLWVRVFAANVILLVVGVAFLALTPLTVSWPLARDEAAELFAWLVVLALLDLVILRLLFPRRPRSPRRRHPGADLTEREVEIVRLIAESYTAKEIGDLLCISPKTVDAHRGHILKKLRLRDRVALTRYAIRHGFIQP